ncbi:MAG TPA: right-handed parallel beta-helix repeat-containing protein [Tepidisphaeraceae bacterium]|nr:right-handed parallel beta-helix repeat-containing protein [Tepidisphaeraceae bacterium]
MNDTISKWISDFRSQGRVSRQRLRAGIPSAQSLEPRRLLTTWFVAPAGSNANPGTLASPFKTIQYAADAARAGDTVDILAGTYHETVTLHHSGTAAAPITFQPYQNQLVTIDGADPISGWTAVNSHVYAAGMHWNLGAGNNQVFLDGKMLNEARWPNSTLDVSHPAFAYVKTVTATTVDAPPAKSPAKPPTTPPPAPVVLSTTYTITNSSMNQPAGFWVGATIRIAGGQDWVYQSSTITASGPGWVTFSLAGSQSVWEAPKASSHFYLTGVAGALDSAGEWFRTSGGTLSLWTPAGDSPANHVVEAKARQYGFDLTQASNIQILGVHLFACSIVTSASSAGIVLNGISDQYVSQFEVTPNGWHPPTSGIVLKGVGDILENSMIADSAGDGVLVAGNSELLSNNVISDIDYTGTDSAPVHLTGTGDTIDSNTISNAGRDGIFFAGYSGTITHNIVHDFGIQTTDLGGFYCFGQDGHQTLIADNEFYNGVTGGFGGSGIMFDNDSSNFIVHHNITWNVNSALRVNFTARNILIYNNTFDATAASIAIHSSAYDWTGTVLENNIFTKSILVGEHTVLLDNVNNKGQFVNPAAGNYALLPGAPAIDAGRAIPPYTNGYVGDAPDDGALAFGESPFAVGALTAKVAVMPSPVAPKTH